MNRSCVQVDLKVLLDSLLSISQKEIIDKSTIFDDALRSYIDLSLYELTSLPSQHYSELIFRLSQTEKDSELTKFLSLARAQDALAEESVTTKILTKLKKDTSSINTLINIDEDVVTKEIEEPSEVLKYITNYGFKGQEYDIQAKSFQIDSESPEDIMSHLDKTLYFCSNLFLNWPEYNKFKTQNITDIHDILRGSVLTSELFDYTIKREKVVFHLFNCNERIMSLCRDLLLSTKNYLIPKNLECQEDLGFSSNKAIDNTKKRSRRTKSSKKLPSEKIIDYTSTYDIESSIEIDSPDCTLSSVITYLAFLFAEITVHDVRIALLKQYNSKIISNICKIILRFSNTQLSLEKQSQSLTESWNSLIYKNKTPEKRSSSLTLKREKISLDEIEKYALQRYRARNNKVLYEAHKNSLNECSKPNNLSMIPPSVLKEVPDVISKISRMTYKVEPIFEEKDTYKLRLTRSSSLTPKKTEDSDKELLSNDNFLIEACDSFNSSIESQISQTFKHSSKMLEDDIYQFTESREGDIVKELIAGYLNNVTPNLEKALLRLYNAINKLTGLNSTTWLIIPSSVDSQEEILISEILSKFLKLPGQSANRLDITNLENLCIEFLNSQLPDLSNFGNIDTTKLLDGYTADIHQSLSEIYNEERKFPQLLTEDILVTKKQYKKKLTKENLYDYDFEITLFNKLTTESGHLNMNKILSSLEDHSIYSNHISIEGNDNKETEKGTLLTESNSLQNQKIILDESKNIVKANIVRNKKIGSPDGTDFKSKQEKNKASSLEDMWSKLEPYTEASKFFSEDYFQSDIFSDKLPEISDSRERFTQKPNKKNIYEYLSTSGNSETGDSINIEENTSKLNERLDNFNLKQLVKNIQIAKSFTLQ